MDGGDLFVLALIALALFMFVKSAAIRVRDTRLRKRLVPVQARVTDPGTSQKVDIFVSEDSEGRRTERRDISYVGVYEYVVGGKRYTGSHTSGSPVFSPREMPPHSITAYYDPGNPAVSRLNTVAPDERPGLYTMFGVVVLVVALVIAFIANIGSLPRRH